MAVIEIYKDRVLGIRKDRESYWVDTEEGLAMVINDSLRWTSIKVNVKKTGEKSYLITLGFFNNKGKFQELEKLLFNDVDAERVEDVSKLTREIKKIIRDNYRILTRIG